MQQQIQINQSEERCLAEAAVFFAKRRAKLTARDEHGFQFGLEGSGQGEGGRVTVAPAPGGGSTVTVAADSLGVLAMAEGYVRELRKQARDQARNAGRASRASAGVVGMQSDLAALRDRLSAAEPAAPTPETTAAEAPPSEGEAETRLMAADAESSSPVTPTVS